MLVDEHKDKSTVSQNVDKMDEDGECNFYAPQCLQVKNSEDPFTRAREVIICVGQRVDIARP